MDATASRFSRPTAEVPRRTFGDRYLTFLSLVLVGYAVGGRGFAYFGLPPIFIGEVALALGLVALIGVAKRARLAPGVVLGGLMVLIAWASVRVLVELPTWRLDAVRDGMLVLYGLFAVVSAGLVLERPERLRWLVARGPRLVWALVLVAWPVHFFVRFFEAFPTWPWADVAIIQVKSGDLLVTMAAAVTFVVVGFQRARASLVVLVAIGVIGLMVTSRSGMLAFTFGVGLASLWKPLATRYGRFLYVGALLIVLGLAAGSSGIQVNGDSREISIQQVWENLKSIAGKSDDASLQGTAEWRLEWWGQIVGYTFGGRHFLDGKGFGINLADDDGFSVDDEGSLRSPHNSHMTVLARGGVPMFLAWLALQGLWFVQVWRSARTARRRGLDGWAGFYAVCGALWIGANVNASFDVYLEGPMGAIPFWVVFGLAIAGTRLQRTHPHLLDDLRVGGRPRRSAPAWSWTAPAPVPREPRAPAPARSASPPVPVAAI